MRDKERGRWRKEARILIMRLYIDMHSRLSYRGKFEFGEWCKSMVPMKERARGLGIGVASTSSDDGLKIRLRQPRKPELLDLSRIP